MNQTLARSILMKMKVGEFVDENWFLRQEGCTREILDAMITEGWLVKKNRDPSNFMSDNQYALTLEGQKFAWDKKEHS